MEGTVALYNLAASVKASDGNRRVFNEIVKCVGRLLFSYHEGDVDFFSILLLTMAIHPKDF